MPKKLLLIILFICLCFSPVYTAIDQPIQEQKAGVLEPFSKTDRVLILAPHPDDEAIGCAGVIQQAVSSGAQVRIAYLTNGDHNQVAFMVY